MVSTLAIYRNDHMVESFRLHLEFFVSIGRAAAPSLHWEFLNYTLNDIGTTYIHAYNSDLVDFNAFIGSLCGTNSLTVLTIVEEVNGIPFYFSKCEKGGFIPSIVFKTIKGELFNLCSFRWEMALMTPNLELALPSRNLETTTVNAHLGLINPRE